MIMTKNNRRLDRIHASYREYFYNCSGADRELRDRAFDYECLFDDMMFQPDSIVSDYICYQVKHNDAEWVNDYPDYYMGLDDNYIRFYVKRLRNYNGYYCHKDRMVVIDKHYANDEATILHEMIHIFESIIDENHSFYHDILTLCLYNHLKERIPDIDNIVLRHSHIIAAHDITRRGGKHDILFYLKSLDLDLRQNLPFGTVCGYDRDNMVEGIEKTGANK